MQWKVSLNGMLMKECSVGSGLVLRFTIFIGKFPGKCFITRISCWVLKFKDVREGWDRPEENMHV
jgi:hypothetical protein